ncbi:hypothetical protein ACFQ1Q_08555 [Winogradskyella litorisediminis]|uniref:YD repeat-containing protein n=1 Tax=Winogradskyella litorisediminis TaxID=1156618 RepID=A0ABW3N742_9FLAO
MKTQLLFVLLCTSIGMFNIIDAQNIRLPEIEAPEKNFYNLLEEQKIKFPKFNNGKIKSVKRTYNIYKNNRVNVTETEVTIFDRNKSITEHYYIHNNEKFDDFSSPPIQYKDSINGGLRIKIIEDETTYKDYIYKSGKLIKYVENAENYYQIENVFKYNANGKLIKRYAYNFDILEDENNNAIAAAKTMNNAEIATYKEKKISEKESFEIWEDIFNYQKIEYQYNLKNHLENYLYTLRSYSTDSLKADINLEKQILSNFKELKVNRKNLKGEFQYNEKSKIKSFTLSDIKSEAILENYNISYQPNSMTILGKFPKPNNAELILKYEYIFDKFKNPISIKSYYKLGETFVLDKETLIEISYYKD